MIEENKQTTNEQTINEEKEKVKVCCVCSITENEATEKGLKFIGMNTLYNKKLDEIFKANLSEFNKIKNAYVCSKCIENTTKMVEKLISNRILNEKEEIHEKIDSFTDYILSSSYLFGLDNAIIMQASFNMYDAAIENLMEENPEFAKHVIKTSLIELERKLQELEKIPN